MVSVWKQTHSNGTSSICRNCATEKAKKYRKTKSGQKVGLEASKRAYIRHKEKWLARAKLRYAITIGEMTKPLKCEVCDRKKTLQGHHEDYTKPMDVIWLCTGCHADADRELEFKKLIK